MISVSATEYEQTASRLLELVCSSGETVQITELGRPIALLTRVEEKSVKRTAGQFRGDARIVGDLFGPIVEPSDWGDL